MYELRVEVNLNLTFLKSQIQYRNHLPICKAEGFVPPVAKQIPRHLPSNPVECQNVKFYDQTDPSVSLKLRSPFKSQTESPLQGTRKMNQSEGNLNTSKFPFQRQSKRSWISFLTVLSTGIYLSSCGIFPKEKTKTIVLDPANPQYLSLANIENAPETVRAASKSVVNIVSEMSSGTGSFVTKDGLLMTNDHVLGSRVCAKLGCYVTIKKNYEAGAKSSYSSIDVFAVPKAVSESLDVAFLQIYSLDPISRMPGPKLSTENYLEFTRETADSLKGKTIHIVGHPASGLKKWSFGDVYESNSNWFKSEAQVLPGSSGSPILNPEGKIVGILHRSANSSLSDMTQQGIRDYSIGTASTSLMDLMGALEKNDINQLALLTDITINTTKDEFIKDAEIYLNSHANEVTLDVPLLNSGTPSQTKVHPAEIMAEAIDTKILASADTKSRASSDELEALASLAASWISCQAQPKGQTFRLCPNGENKEKWISRIETIIERTKEMNGEPPIYLLANYAYYLSSSTASGDEAAVKSILKYSGSEINFSTAFLLLGYADRKSQPKFGTMDLETYIMTFESNPKYEHYYSEIIRSLGYLYGDEFITESEIYSKINSILKDPKTTLRERIRAERLAFSAGLI